jgi:glycosyltransferase involved in cell wall biosynthesis
VENPSHINKNPLLSIVIPVYNEMENIPELYNKLADVLDTLGHSYEIIFIDDGSTDGTFNAIKSLQSAYVRVISFKRNFGKSAALACGFSNARGELVITMDGDLQDDPKEIPRFIQALDNYDMVSGWKYKRNDLPTKTIPSKVFNKLTGALTGVNLHDFNCGFKAYHSDVIKGINLYGEMHRYIPVIAVWKGFSVGEITVEHHKRAHGYSKFGASRLVRGMFDLVTIKFLISYSKRPMHFFGTIGMAVSAIGTIICSYLLILWLGGTAIGGRPLLMLGVLLLITGIQFISIGLIGELIISTRHNNDWITR